MSYNDKLDATQQVDAEEEIASYLFDAYISTEEDANNAGKRILAMVLRRFRKDLIDLDFWEFGHGVEDWTGLGLLDQEEDYNPDTETKVETCPECGASCNNDVTISDHGHCYDCHERWKMGEFDQEDPDSI